MDLEAIFFDRDGVINVDYGYVSSVERLEFVDGIFDLVTWLPDSVGKFIVTNQAGIARGLYDADNLKTLMSAIFAEFNGRGVDITDWRYCPHHPAITGPCDCRKPSPGMINDLVALHHLNPANCILIGDKMSDVRAGRAAGLGLCILLDNRTNNPTNQFLKLSDSVVQVNTIAMAARVIQEHISL